MKISRPSLAVYLMANEAAPELAEAAVRGGATVIELGIPYSDPLADGTTIQRAAQAALDAGITPARALELLAFRPRSLGDCAPPPSLSTSI